MVPRPLGSAALDKSRERISDPASVIGSPSCKSRAAVGCRVADSSPWRSVVKCCTNEAHIRRCNRHDLRQRGTFGSQVPPYEW